MIHPGLFTVAIVCGKMKTSYFLPGVAMKKLLFFDIDGTLAYPRQEPAPAVAEAIRQARERGHVAFISTGRTSDSIPEAVERIGFDGGIFSAGGEIRLGGSLLAVCHMEEKLLGEVLGCLRGIPVFYVLETADGRFHSENAGEILGMTDMTGVPEEMRRFTEAVLYDPTMQPMARYRGQRVFKIAYYCPCEGTAVELAAGLEGVAKVVPFDNIPGLPLAIGEISDPAVNKGRALELVCRHFGMTKEDCIAFGDSMNDAEILLAAGLGVAMGNADPKLKALADLVCDRCENDGVAKAMGELGLI